MIQKSHYDGPLSLSIGEPSENRSTRQELEKSKEAFQSKVDKEREAEVPGMAIARIPMSFIVLLPHMRRAFREAYVQKMALVKMVHLMVHLLIQNLLNVAMN